MTRPPPDNPPREFPASGAGDAWLHNRPREPEPAASEYNVPAIVGMCCGILGLVVLQIVLAPAAIILGAFGVHYAENRAPGTRRLAIACYALGIADGLIWLTLASVWHVAFFPL